MSDVTDTEGRLERAPRILVMDDDGKIAKLQQEVLDKAGYEVEVATTIPQARRQVAKAFFDLLVLDQRMPSGSGLEFFRECRERYPDIGAVFLTGYPDVRLAREAFREGALDFLMKGIRQDQLLVAVEEALRRSRLKRENRYLRHKVAADRDTTGIVGQSRVLQAAKDLVQKAAAVDAPVLLEGESGTGKELFAKAIHTMSPRGQGNLICINTGALPRSLLESELFGHTKGAFTGADRIRQGAFEAADGGTIFLDEIGEMSLDAQVRLLRVLDERKVTRLGESASIPLDVRIIAATNKLLETEVEEKRFREDLYYRLAVLRIVVPPLRHRFGDVGLLAQYFLEQEAARTHKEISGFTPEAMGLLNEHVWPGNVRELKNAVERAVILCDDDEIACTHLSFGSHKIKSERNVLDLPWKVAQDVFGKRYFEVLLNRADGNKVRAARLAQIDRSSLYDCLRRYGIEDAG